MRAGVLTVMVGALAGGGCQAIEKAQKRTEDQQVRDDVVDISQFITMVPWRWDEEAGGVTGMNVRVYLVSAQTGRGTFVSGDLVVHLDVLVPQRDGSYVRQTLHTWTFDEQEAYGFRVTKPSIMGASYGLILTWPPEIDVGGREVQLTFEYQRRDGQLIVRRGSRKKVPDTAKPIVPQKTAESRPPAPRQVRIPAQGQSTTSRNKPN
jgi:hypothetical protein